MYYRICLKFFLVGMLYLTIWFWNLEPSSKTNYLPIYAHTHTQACKSKSLKMSLSRIPHSVSNQELQIQMPLGIRWVPCWEYATIKTTVKLRVRGLSKNIQIYFFFLSILILLIKATASQIQPWGPSLWSPQLISAKTPLEAHYISLLSQSL